MSAEHVIFKPWALTLIPLGFFGCFVPTLKPSVWFSSFPQGKSDSDVVNVMLPVDYHAFAEAP